MPDFLIDVNLPAKIKTWQSDRFISVSTIYATWDDQSIWDYAKKNNLTIISKDKDFFTEQMLKGSPRKLFT